MTNTLPIYKREMKSYFTSPVAYVVIAMFLLITGYLFANQFWGFVKASQEAYQRASDPMFGGQIPILNITESVLRSVFGTMSFILLLVLPMLSMKLFAEEKRLGTIELLFSYPIKDWELVLGKFLASMTLFTIMLATTLPYPLMLHYFGDPETPTIITSYIGIFLMGMGFISLGVFVSSMTENQIVAVVGSFGALLLFWLLGIIAPLASPKVGAVLRHAATTSHVQNFVKGIVESRDVVYYLNFTFFFLFLTLCSLGSKKWRG
ncbi:ABC transporter permease [Candidatus Hydrogenedentota bacterium]